MDIIRRQSSRQDLVIYYSQHAGFTTVGGAALGNFSSGGMVLYDLSKPKTTFKITNN
jgi:hypothetical protein